MLISIILKTLLENEQIHLIKLTIRRETIESPALPRSQIQFAFTIILFLVAALLFLAVPASAGCYVEGASERLGNYCALDKVRGKRIDFQTAQLIDYKLKIEGRQNGLGFPSRIKPMSFSRAIYPVLSYSDNVNGGNPIKPLVLGNLRFNGEEALFRKQGFLTGLGLGFSGRYIHNEGRYVEYSANVSHALAIEHGISVKTMAANACSVNHVKNWWYLDACLNTSNVQKELTNQSNSNFSVSSSKVFESRDGVYSEVSFGINRTFTDNYSQNQLTFGYETIHSNGTFSDIQIKFGEPTQNKLSTKLAINVRVSAKIANKPLTIMTRYSKADGGLLLGFKREDSTYSLQATYPIWGNLHATIGYTNTESTIDYFDTNTPIFGLQFAQKTF